MRFTISRLISPSSKSVSAASAFSPLQVVHRSGCARSSNANYSAKEVLEAAGSAHGSASAHENVATPAHDSW